MAKLNLVPNPTFESKVGFYPPGDDAKPLFAMLKFKYRSKKELDEWMASRAGVNDVESFMDMVVGWDIDDLPYNAENVETVFNIYPGTPTSAFRVYIDQLIKVKLGN